ncbi:hypothetical protein I316_07754 [Kwoniella heveanensis BCC8398]|uniref:Uncharacterized protein n=1 Tax=Kwoniella heveanensis BCC8398 TaxID=1296120 RepID=A0A1B9GHY6_9TREE|nr:hypothetical protein I316_07754 [Kwoniella heveanensis BCC8398]
MSTASTALVPFHASTAAGYTTEDDSGISVSADETALVRSGNYIPTDSATERITALGAQSGHSDVTDYLVQSARHLQDGKRPEPQSDSIIQSMNAWSSENPQQAEEVFHLGGNLLGAAAASRGVDLETDDSRLLTEGGETDESQSAGTEIVPFGGDIVRAPADVSSSVVPYDRNTVMAPSHYAYPSLRASEAPFASQRQRLQSGMAPSNGFDALRNRQLTRYPRHMVASEGGPQAGAPSTQAFAGQRPRGNFTPGPALSEFQSIVGGILGRFKENMVHENGGFHITKESPDGDTKTESGFTSGVMSDGSKVSCSVTSTTSKGQDPVDIASAIQRMSEAFDTMGFPSMMRSKFGSIAGSSKGPASRIMI